MSIINLVSSLRLGMQFIVGLLDGIRETEHIRRQHLDIKRPQAMVLTQWVNPDLEQFEVSRRVAWSRLEEAPGTGGPLEIVIVVDLVSNRGSPGPGSVNWIGVGRVLYVKVLVRYRQAASKILTGQID